MRSLWITAADQIRISERDSRKDEAVVFIFIIATAGLLGWAAIKPWVGGWIEVSAPAGYAATTLMTPARVPRNGEATFLSRMKVTIKSQEPNRKQGKKPGGVFGASLGATV